MTTYYTNTNTNSSTTTSSTWANIYNTGTSTATTINTYPTGSIGNFISNTSNEAILSGSLRVHPGTALSITLPDGATLEIQANGSYKIVDANAQITYKANNVREFNRYINGSDMLEEFIKFISGIGKINKQEFFNLPVELFIQWLVIRAAEQDGEDADYTPVIKALPNPNRHKHSIRCKCCGKFMINRELLFCSSEHMNKYSLAKNIFQPRALTSNPI
jgi:hypothetical protein